MEESKMNSGVFAIMLVALIFAGWEATLIVSALLLIFGKLDDRRRNLLISVLTFVVGVALFRLCWSLVTDGISLVLNSLDNFLEFIGSFLDEPISTYNLNKYFITPVTKLVNIASDIVAYAITVFKYLFAISLLTGKALGNNFLFNFIYKYIEKALNFVNQNTESFYQQGNNNMR
ncbi:MAG: hypothetical protein IJK66_04645 [Bacilli bacterium]|nr:hypothetical protein [Bacilli bacterium]